MSSKTPTEKPTYYETKGQLFHTKDHIQSTFQKEILKGFAGAGALTGVALPHVHSQVDDTVQIALVGCGGRGTGAAHNALQVSAANGPTKLVSMADVSQTKLDRSYAGLKAKNKEKVDVPPERRHVGFDGYKHAMDALKPGDIAIFTTPCAFRWVHFAKAIEKGLHVFMEKPVTPDGFSSRKMLELNEKAKAKKLKIGVGLMCRHSQARRELHARIQDGELGDLLLFTRLPHAATDCILLLRKETSR